MKIKPIKDASDLDSIAEIYMSVYSESPYNETWDKEKFLKRINELSVTEKETSFLIRDEEHVVGFIFCQSKTWHDGDHLIIEDIALLPQHRGQGIGTKLVLHVEQCAKEKGFVGIDLFANKNAEAFDFWKKKGYETSDWTHLQKKL